MPQVPIQEGLQVGAQAQQGGYQDTPDVTGGARALTQGLNQAAGMVDKIAERQDQDTAWAADAKIKTDAAAFTSSLQQRMKGGAVNGTTDPTTGESTGSYAQQVQAYWAKTAQTAGANLNPAQKSFITRSLAMSQAAAVHSALDYQNSELDKSWAESAQASLAATTNLALQTGTPAAAAVAADSIRNQVSAMAVHKGIVDANGTPDANWINEQTLKQTTVLHANMVGQIQQTDPAAAQKYFDAAKAKGEIDGTQIDNIQKSLTVAVAASTGLAGAHDAFNAHVPAGATPASGDVPLDVTAMRADLEKKFAGNPTALNAANDSLNRMVADWKTSEQQYQTNYKATLEQGVAGGKGLAWVQQQPEWQKLDGTTQAAITDHLQNRAYTMQLRANAAETHQLQMDARQDAVLARQDAAERRADAAKGRENFDQYIDLQMNPDKLAGMSTQAVQNLGLTMSQPQVESLVGLRQRLNNSADLHNATMDKDSFGQVAESFGMKSPIDPDATKQDKAIFAQTKMNVDAVLTQMQQAKKAPLTQQEKIEAMRNEMARTVTVNPGWFSSNVTTPVVSLTPEQATQVEVPDTDRSLILQALQAKYQQNPKNPAYAPTEANIRSLYLRKVSPAGKLINTGPQNAQ